ncbi:MAG: Hpt domain-containing protein [Pseudomonadota bacterium]
MSAGYRLIAPQVLWQAAGADLDTFRSLSQLFLDLAPARLAALEQALQRGPAGAVAAASHALKGMTLLVGADQLSALLQELERQARAGAAAPPAALADLLQGVMDEVAASMAHYHGAEPPP